MSRRLGLTPESLATVADVVMRSAGSHMSLRGGHRGNPDHSPDHNRGRLFDLLDRYHLRRDGRSRLERTLTELIASRPHL